ncbi:lia operon protein LiaF [Oceanobacillus limi]|uniref:Lia operon protein LiaF n=1 Tax=Oceanobacillus limi TaxID=930131 RepID=A0A1H9YLF0_9BACI|nr:cell wall-active antibiotics response protein LiaF [Oceanobacillus limi]SES69948.1 lia operon protein LiaF [Oceanobacillus limi]
MRYIIATILIVLGAMLVLENIGVASFNMGNAWFFIYPVIFVVLGIKWIIDRYRNRGGSWIFGSFFFIFGTLLLLDRFEVISFVFKDVFKLWPLLIVYFGFLFIGKSKGPNVIITSGGDKKSKSHYNGSIFTVGSHEYNQPNWKVEPMNLSNLAGDFYLDFSKAYIPEKEIPIKISALAGDVHLLIPENIDFRVHASVKAGDIDVVGRTADGINRSLQYETENYHMATRKLDLHLKLKAGSIRVDYV